MDKFNNLKEMINKGGDLNLITLKGKPKKITDAFSDLKIISENFNCLIISANRAYISAMGACKYDSNRDIYYYCIENGHTDNIILKIYYNSIKDIYYVMDERKHEYEVQIKQNFKYYNELYYRYRNDYQQLYRGDYI